MCWNSLPITRSCFNVLGFVPIHFAASLTVNTSGVLGLSRNVTYLPRTSSCVAPSFLLNASLCKSNAE